VIREGTAITVEPTYTNALNVDIDNKAVLKIYSSEDNYEAVFAEVTAEDGIFVIDSSVIQNSSFKYKAQLETDLYEAKEPVKSGMISLNVKMGSAKLTLTARDNTLFAQDKHDRVVFELTAADRTLNEAVRVEIKDKAYQGLFRIYDYGNGQFSIGFEDAAGAAKYAGKTITVNLNVFLEGNQTAKVNTTAKLKISIVK